MQSHENPELWISSLTPRRAWKKTMFHFLPKRSSVKAKMKIVGESAMVPRKKLMNMLPESFVAFKERLQKNMFLPVA